MGNRISNAPMAPRPMPAGLAYLPNDPATPDIAEEIEVPVAPSPEITVVGYRPGPAIKGSVEHQAAQVYAAISFALATAQDSLPSRMATWSTVGNLVAIPRAGEQLNALYDRSSLRFFYWMNHASNMIAYACESADVVSHETGHAVLDALRPELWNMQSLEVAAFHEAYGDCLAVLACLQHSSVVSRVLEETEGNLGASNSASRIAEALGVAILAAGGVADRLSLRDAVNGFYYYPPEELPERAGADKISRDPHRFGLVFLGAFWDVIRELHRMGLREGMTGRQALMAARDKASRLLHLAVCKAKARPKFMASMARAIIAADETIYGGRHVGLLRDVFNDRGIICDIPFACQFGQDGLDPVKPGGESETIKVSIPSVGNAVAYMAAATGCLHEESVIDCNLAVRSILSKGLVGGIDSMYSLRDGHIVRNHICQGGTWAMNV